VTEDVRTQSDAQRRRSGSVATSDVVRDEAVGVGQTVADAGSHLAQTAADQAKDIAAQTRQQAKSLLQHGRQQLHDQTVFQQQKVALRLTTVADELRELAHHTSSDSMSEWTRQGADQLHQFASWLHDREPDELLEQVRSFARRRPGAFLLQPGSPTTLARRSRRHARRPPEAPSQRPARPNVRRTIPTTTVATAMTRGGWPGEPLGPGSPAGPRRFRRHDR
jgi:hypothetical protein